jgi:hypothetical protein
MKIKIKGLVDTDLVDEDGMFELEYGVVVLMAALFCFSPFICLYMPFFFYDMKKEKYL